MNTRAARSPQQPPSEELQEEIDARRKEIFTDAYAMSIGELANIYEDGELDLHPEFQRMFRWTLLQKSWFIESLLLNIPVPSIFVYQNSDANWDVIDGLQRLSTIFEFMGILRDERGCVLTPSTLQAGQYVKQLEGKNWQGDSPDSLSDLQRRLIKRAKLDVRIIKRESSEEARLHLFNRLNTGGSALSEQEVRNCLILMSNKNVLSWLGSMAESEAFRTCLSITDRAERESYDYELVTRFLVFWSTPHDELRQMKDVHAFLTEHITRIARDLAASEDGTESHGFNDVFRGVFEILAETVGSDAFRKYDEDRDKFTGGFSVAAYELVTLSLSKNLKKLQSKDVETQKRLVLSEISKAWRTVLASKRSGGRRATERIPTLLAYLEVDSELLKI